MIFSAAAPCSPSRLRPGRLIAAALFLATVSSGAVQAEDPVPLHTPAFVASEGIPQALSPLAGSSHRALLAFSDDPLYPFSPVRLRILGEGGRPEGSEIALELGPLEFIASIATTRLSGGTYVTSWSVGTNGSLPSETTFRQRRFDASGTPLAGVSEVEASDLPGDPELEIAALPDGGWLTVWINRFPGVLGAPDENFRLYGRRFRADGSPAGPRRVLYENPSGTIHDFALEVAPQGGAFLVWENVDFRPDELLWSIRALRLSTAGEGEGPVLQLLAPRTKILLGDLAATLAPDGEISLFWSESPQTASTADHRWRVWARRFQPNGSPVGDPLPVLPTADPGTPFHDRLDDFAPLPGGGSAISVQRFIETASSEPSNIRHYLMTWPRGLGPTSEGSPGVTPVQGAGYGRLALASSPTGRLRAVWPDTDTGQLVAQDFLIPCTPASGDVCLHDGRFEIDIQWKTPEGAEGRGTAVPLTSEASAFWFFRPENLELVVKVVDACERSGRYWVFAAGLTNVEVIIRVTDLATRHIRVYRREGGAAFQPIYDTNAFATCAAAP